MITKEQHHAILSRPNCEDFVKTTLVGKSWQIVLSALLVDLVVGMKPHIVVMVVDD